MIEIQLTKRTVVPHKPFGLWNRKVWGGGGGATEAKKYYFNMLRRRKSAVPKQKL